MTVEIATLEALRGGGKRAMAAALAAAEQTPDSPGICRLHDDAFLAARAHVIGITGPPGVGKSTLIDALIRHWRGESTTVGVIAVDPSSHVSGGALLGDRIRMRTDPADQGVFVRSLAARGRLGGLAELTFAAVVLMRAVYDRVIVESVGVGQSEADIAAVTDTVVLCIQPGSGDALQFMKAGIMEIPDLAVVTKADTGAAACRALADLKGALSLAVPRAEGWQPQCLAVSAATGDGLAALMAAADDHYRRLGESGRLAAQRREQAEAWLRSTVAARFGRTGLDAARDHLRLAEGDGPFAREKTIAASCRVDFSTPGRP